MSNGSLTMNSLPIKAQGPQAMSAIIGLLLFIPTLAIAALLPDPLAVDWLAVLLVVAAAIYVGFALKDARPRPLVIELGFASFTLLLVLAGMWWHPWTLALGYVLHGLWDVLHFGRRRVIHTQLPWWYAVFCLTYDWLVAAYMLWRWT